MYRMFRLRINIVLIKVNVILRDVRERFYVKIMFLDVWLNALLLKGRVAQVIHCVHVSLEKDADTNQLYRCLLLQPVLIQDIIL